MTEREAAVAWLERNYDEQLRLVTERFSNEEWGRAMYFTSVHRPSARGLMFTVKDQNG